MNLLVQEFFEDLSEEEEEEDELDEEEDMAILMLLDMERNKRRKHGGSMPGRETIHRRRQEGHCRLMAEYFDPDPVYPPRLFRRRFRMSPNLFKRIAAAVENHDEYFKQKRNSAGNLGLSPYQKITAALRMMTYGVPADFLDDCVAIAEIELKGSFKCTKRSKTGRPMSNYVMTLWRNYGSSMVNVVLKFIHV